jgi:hypothetical protein
VGEDFVYSSATAPIMSFEALREVIASVVPIETLALSLRKAAAG